MASGRDTKLTGAIGEYLVAAELCRLGLIAAPFAGNVPHYDVIASDPNGGHIAVQVKAIRKGSWQFNIDKFLDVQMDKKKQVLGASEPEPFPNLVCVLVALRDEQPGSRDRFFVMPWTTLRDIVVRGYRAYLTKHGFVRPKQPNSFHCQLKLAEVVDYEGRWDLIGSVKSQ